MGQKREQRRTDKGGKWWTIREDKNCQHSYTLLRVNGPRRSRPTGEPNAVGGCVKCGMEFATESITTYR